MRTKFSYPPCIQTEKRQFRQRWGTVNKEVSNSGNEAWLLRAWTRDKHDGQFHLYACKPRTWKYSQTDTDSIVIGKQKPSQRKLEHKHVGYCWLKNSRALSSTPCLGQASKVVSTKPCDHIVLCLVCISSSNKSVHLHIWSQTYHYCLCLQSLEQHQCWDDYWNGFS